MERTQPRHIDRLPINNLCLYFSWKRAGVAVCLQAAYIALTCKAWLYLFTFLIRRRRGHHGYPHIYVNKLCHCINPKPLFLAIKASFDTTTLASIKLLSSLEIVMATTSFSLFSFYFCVLLLCHGSMAQLFSPWQSSRQGGFRECKFDRLQALEPLRQVRSQAGLTEYFDEANEHFRCTGVFVIRRVIEPRGLLLPRYTNTHGLVYIIQGWCNN